LLFVVSSDLKRTLVKAAVIAMGYIGLPLQISKLFN